MYIHTCIWVVILHGALLLIVQGLQGPEGENGMQGDVGQKGDTVIYYMYMYLHVRASSCQFTVIIM